ncbi:MAG: ribonuclease III [Acidobacteriia bacterium]|jgi:ribonuclease-3|nr:ribonuclease III [Terriglobia bacterium]
MAENSRDQFQASVGYRFRNPHFLLEALTHASFAQESAERPRDNEQLEFLGDAVLTFVVSVILAEAFPDWEEGKLTRARSRLVAAPHLYAVASRLSVGEHLRLGRGEEKTGGRNKPALLVNALEAVVAALYRDGGIQAARQFIERFIVPDDLEACADDLFSIDYKSALQEHLQAGRMPPAEYRVVEESGPEHQKTFTVEVVTGDNRLARGRGGSKKAAEQEAARTILEELGRKTETDG